MLKVSIADLYDVLNAFIIIARAWRPSNLVILNTYIIYSWKSAVLSILTYFTCKSFLFYSHCLSVFFFSSSSGFGLFVCLRLSCLFAGFIAQKQQTKLTSLNCCASLHVPFLSPELQSLWTISSSDQKLWLAMGPGFTHKHSSFTFL